ncbi:hypothetical protein EJB05_12989, partial [Eragrostis curvula]
MGAAGSPESPDAGTAAVEAVDILPASPTQKVLVDAEGLLEEATEHARIHRFPHHLRGIAGADKRYMVPSVVAIGPYHRNVPHLRKMEEVKLAVANKLCKLSGLSIDKVYQKVLAVASDVRRCYGEPINLTNDELASMMFLDGCFLLGFMSHLDDPMLVGCSLSCGPSFLKDIFLLENQVPWQVLQLLMAEFEINDDMPAMFAAGQGKMLSPARKKEKKRWGCIPYATSSSRPPPVRAPATKWKRRDGVNNENESSKGTGDEMEAGSCTPPHLLGLLRSVLISRMPPQKRESKCDYFSQLESINIGAIELVQSGVKLTASTAGWFPEMKCRKKKFFFGELSLSPLFLNDVMACWLVNMLALESVEATNALCWDKDGYVMSSYVSMLAMLMDREEDVHELRKSGVLSSNFSNAQTLAFFKALGQHLRLGYNYFNTLGEIYGYMSRRPRRIAVYKFLYNNYKTVAVVLSIVGALISILKALYSLKRA